MSKYQFTLPSSSGSDFKSAEHLPLVVYFYPKDSTPGCTTEGLDFNARLEQFKHWLYRCRYFARRRQIASEFLRQTRLPVWIIERQRRNCLQTVWRDQAEKSFTAKNPSASSAVRLCWTKTAKSPMNGAKSKWPDTRRKFWIQFLKPLNRALKPKASERM